MSSPPFIGPRLKLSADTDFLLLGIWGSPLSSPKRKAAFSRPWPEFGRRPDLRNGDEDFGCADLTPDAEESSGSNIQLKFDCAMLDRVGSDDMGLLGGLISSAGSTGVLESGS